MILHVDVSYIITPPTNQTMTALFSQVLRPGISNSTAALGLAMDAQYLNSTIRLVSCGLFSLTFEPWQTHGQKRRSNAQLMPVTEIRTCRRVPQASASPSPAIRHATHAWRTLPEQLGQKAKRGVLLFLRFALVKNLAIFLATALPQHGKRSILLCGLRRSSSDSSNGALIGGIVGGVVGGLLVLAAAVAAVLLWRRRKRRRAGLAPGKLSANSSFSAAASGNSVKPHSSVELAVGSQGEPLRNMYGGTIAGSADCSDSDSGGSSALRLTFCVHHTFCVCI